MYRRGFGSRAWMQLKTAKFNASSTYATTRLGSRWTLDESRMPPLTLQKRCSVDPPRIPCGRVNQVAFLSGGGALSVRCFPADRRTRDVSFFSKGIFKISASPVSFTDLRFLTHTPRSSSSSLPPANFSRAGRLLIIRVSAVHGIMGWTHSFGTSALRSTLCS